MAIQVIHHIIMEQNLLLYALVIFTTFKSSFIFAVISQSRITSLPSGPD